MEKDKKTTNQICGRLCIQIRGRLASPLSIGSGEDQDTDSDVVLRADGLPVIPGSALAGAMRSFLEQQTGADRADGLFGASRMAWEMEKEKKAAPEEAERQSRIFVYDTVLNRGRLNTRDGVRLTENKTARDMSLFQRQIVEKNADFCIRLEILERKELFRSNPVDREEMERIWKEDKELLDILLSGLQCGKLRVGARSTRGLGRLKVDQAAMRSFYMPEDYEAWLNWDWDQTGAFQKEHQYQWKDRMGSRLHCLSVELSLRGTLLVRQYGDSEYVRCRQERSRVAASEGRQEESRVVIPGSTWAGAVRGRIAGLVSELAQLEDWEAAQQLLTPFFGTWQNGGKQKERIFSRDKGDKGEKEEHSSSRVIFEESEVEGGKEMLITRNAVDRFTGGVVKGALFTEKPWAGGKTCLQIRWPAADGDEFPSDAVCGMLLWAMEDLRAGLLAVGGGTAAGRGIFEGTREILLDGKELRDKDNYFQAAARWVSEIKGKS